MACSSFHGTEIENYPVDNSSSCWYETSFEKYSWLASVLGTKGLAQISRSYPSRIGH